MKNKDGFTMLEVLFAMAIFAVAMFGVIGLQVHAIQTDEETRRKDMAGQLLTAGVEMVECTDYGATSKANDLFRNGNVLPDTGFGAFVDDVQNENISMPWMTWNNGNASLYLRHEVDDRDVDGDGDTDFSVRNVYLVAAWKSITTSGIKTMTRMMVKPQNNLQ
ncbi:type IV pilus modification PilV family protein [Desulfoluna spongiiphila]|uniref:Prepilin-type N-terminal cleavage/methylation domain-containing protein n=1 Tax=Desulfoluna spongiiphila TaxID=419481 RepID=A0A1G5AKK0_9BACT|nr:prepilin-type N-terminal cleavage/methylation domain-containing protein [Desulfoluna spongiiphila]SCX78417.1 prepilin-type N-terminal cleavage/methylation domain-containing protein [Desulfoluna spongiiphila]